jgi:hypothetical protein
VGLGEGRRWLKGDEGEEGQGVRGGTPGRVQPARGWKVKLSVVPSIA